jgi:hypothetical protein
MRNLRSGLSLLLLCTLAACQSNPGKKEQDVNPAFPVSDFFRSQLQTIDSLRLPVTGYFNAPGANDTTALSLQQARDFAAPFLEFDLNEKRFEGKYKETSFADQSIPSITFIYEAQDSSLPLRRVDIVLKPDPVNNDQVRSVFMEKSYLEADTVIAEKLYWKADHFYQVIRIRQPADTAKQVISQMKIVWDPTE